MSDMSILRHELLLLKVQILTKQSHLKPQSLSKPQRLKTSIKLGRLSSKMTWRSKSTFSYSMSRTVEHLSEKSRSSEKLASARESSWNVKRTWIRILKYTQEQDLKKRSSKNEWKRECMNSKICQETQRPRIWESTGESKSRKQIKGESTKSRVLKVKFSITWSRCWKNNM